MVVLVGWAISYERGTHVQIMNLISTHLISVTGVTRN